jgi:polar amino acid transport system permease protein
MLPTYEWNFAVVLEYREVFLRAIGLTLTLAVTTILCGMALGLALYLLRANAWRVVSGLMAAIVEVLRAVPPLVLLVWIYYCMPILTGLSLTGFQTAVLALSLYSSAFYSEIFRAGFQSIEKGQIEAGFSVGMTRFQILHRITGPLAFQRIFPPLVSQCVLVIKNTSLAGYIAVAEILYQGQQISIRTFRPLEVLTIVALIFLAVILPLTLFANVMEAKYRKKYFS